MVKLARHFSQIMFSLNVFLEMRWDRVLRRLNVIPKPAFLLTTWFLDIYFDIVKLKIAPAAKQGDE